MIYSVFVEGGTSIWTTKNWFMARFYAIILGLGSNFRWPPIPKRVWIAVEVDRHV